MNIRNKDTFTLVIGMFLVVGIPIGYSTAIFHSEETIIIKVLDKERITTKGESKYLVFCDGETFENTDTWLYFKWNSSDVQGVLTPGKTYKVSVVGWRVPILSMYRNIIRIGK